MQSTVPLSVPMTTEPSVCREGEEEVDAPNEYCHTATPVEVFRACNAGHTHEHTY